MANAFYRKYRPKNLSEIVGQEHISTTLVTALKNGKISHAYLFTGPKGVGKTSIARILAHEVNGLAYEDDSLPLDIIEIDAASNRRIDEIRDLRDKVHIAPTSSKYKVYIIDEVHMLTREAFNALLKTLEEPPAHVIFILATTEAHKLPETIISRTQRFTFKPVDQQKVVDHLKSIAQQEGIRAEDEALQLIAEHGEGSFRDSISLLDQASNADEMITLVRVQAMLGIAPPEVIEEIMNVITTGKPKHVLALLRNLREQGLHAASIAKQLSTSLRFKVMDDSLTIPLTEATKLMGQMLKVASASDSERQLEVVLLDANFRLAGAQVSAASLPKANPLPVKQAAHKTSLKPNPAKPQPKAEAVIEAPVRVAIATLPVDSSFEQIWQELLTTIRSRYNTLYSVLRMATPQKSDDGTIVLPFKFAFHQKRVNDAKNRQIIMDILSTLTTETLHIECIVDKDMENNPPAPFIAPPAAIDTNIAEAEVSASSPLGAIANVFGGAEVLEA